jgi:hypothetical protein
MNLFLQGVKLNEEDLMRFQQFVRELQENLQQAERRGDIHFEMQILSLLGNLIFRSDPEGSEPYWRKYLALFAENDQPSDPVALARLATLAYLREDRGEVDALLRALPSTLIARFGGIEDVSMGFGTAEAVRSVFQDLLRVALDRGAPWLEIRLISELTRDTIGQAKLIRNRTVQTIDRSRIANGITDEAVSTLANSHGPIGVLEWVDVHRNLFAMLTTINSDGSILTEPIQLGNMDLFDIRSRIMQRLSVWHSGRVGDPFDFAPWTTLERWLRGEVEKRLGDGRHLVLIDHESLVGLPWHVALAPRWRCSYAPGWKSLLRESDGLRHDQMRVGVFAVPRYNDALVIREVISQSVKTTKRWAEAKGHLCTAFENESADREAFERLMATCRVVKLLCHGYASPEDHEIALLVSNAGALPPLYAPGDLKLTDSNRLSWRDLQSLPRAAPLVLSAGCSTGLQWQAGAGEQMGLFGALRQAGTRSFIGPRWDVVAEAVVPMLDEVLVRYFDEKATLMDALYQTCMGAEARLPRWLAWSLSLEGDWR